MHPICHTQLSCTLQQAALIIRIGTTNNVHIHLQIGGEQRERLHQQMRALQRLSYRQSTNGQHEVSEVSLSGCTPGIV